MKTILLGAAFCAALSVAANASTIVSYVSTNSDGSIAPTFEAPGVEGQDLARGAGLVPNAGSTYNSRDWDEFVVEAAFAAEDFLTFGFSSENAYDLTSIDIRYDRSATGPTSAQLLYFSGPNTVNSLLFDTDVSVNGEDTTIDLSFLKNVTSFSLALVAWGATSDRGTFDIENANAFGGNGIRINGVLSPIAAVPLPAGLPLLLGGLALLGGFRRRD